MQPRTAAFPEIIAATGGGVLCEPNDAKALGEAIERVLLDPVQARSLANAGRAAVEREFNATAMAERTLRVLEQSVTRQTGAA